MKRTLQTTGEPLAQALVLEKRVGTFGHKLKKGPRRIFLQSSVLWTEKGTLALHSETVRDS